MITIKVPRAKRIRFRELKASDRPLIEQGLNVPAVTKFLGDDPDLFCWLLRDQQAQYSHTFWPIELGVSGDFIGICGLVTVDESDSTVLGSVELGYRLKPSAQGNGYATEAAAACLRYAFEEEDVWRVVSRTTVENKPSWSVMKKIGMRHDPRLDYLSSHNVPFIVHVMTFDDWRGSGGAACKEILRGAARTSRS